MTTNSNDLPPLDVQRVLKHHGIRPNKALGQNFLKDDRILEKIIRTSNITRDDTVLEIGPGLGSLTRHLALSAREVIAVELDEKLLPPLKEMLSPYDNVTIHQGNILEIAVRDLIKATSFSAIANIPYYITSAIIRHLLENSPRPSQIVFTIQKEVAERICEAPGKMSLLALSVQVFGVPSIAIEIPATAFFPEPTVDSAVLKLDIYKEPLIPTPHLDLFFRLAKAGFSQKRKTLRNSLSAGLSLPVQKVETLLQDAAIEPKRRAETLNLQEWSHLTHVYVNKVRAGNI